MPQDPENTVPEHPLADSQDPQSQLQPEDAVAEPAQTGPSVEEGQSSLADLPPVKKSILPTLAIVFLASLMMFGAVLGLLYMKTRKPHRSNPPVAAQSQASQKVNATGAPAEGADAYGDAGWVAPAQREPSKEAPEKVAGSEVPGPRRQQKPVVTELTKKEQAAQHKAATSGGEEMAPDIRLADRRAADSYGENGGVYGAADLAEGGAAGRPMMLPKDKHPLPEQYFADVVPVAKRPAGKKQGKPAPVIRAPGGELVLGGPGSPAAEAVPEAYAPAGRVIPCRLVFAVDSSAGSSGGTIVGMTTQDLEFEGRVIVPKDSEVLGRVGKAIFESKTEGRVFDSGSWRLILPRQPGFPAGRELVVRGTAHLRKELAVEPSGRVRQWDRELDGRPGLPGKVVSMRDAAKWKSLGMAALGSLAKESLATLKDERPTGGLTGGYEDSPSMKNVGVNSASEVVGGAGAAIAEGYEAEASRLAEYVSVESGVEFYLFVEDTILPADAAVGRKARNAASRDSKESPQPPSF